MTKPRTILLIDRDQSTRRQRAVMLLTHGYLVQSAETVEDLKLPFIGSPPDLILLRLKEPHDHPKGDYAAIRKALPNQRIGVIFDDGHELCEVFVDGVLARPREELVDDLMDAVKSMFETGSIAKHAILGS